MRAEERGHAGEADAAAARGGAPSRAGVMLRADSRGRRAHKGWRSRAREVQRRLRRDEPALVSHTELGECNEACRCTTKQKLALRASRELVTAVQAQVSDLVRRGGGVKNYGVAAEMRFTSPRQRQRQSRNVRPRD